MATAPRRSGQVDEEFLQHLYRGGELLAAGKVIEAKDYLEKAHKLAPKNEKGQNLLGLTYFKLGLFDRAAEIYELLVRENPADPTLRVNLGLVYLKANSLQRAIREFETATDLAPEHKKAHNYLGLALAQAGEYGRAREHFVQAGSDAMVEKMERAIAGEQVVKPIASPVANGAGFAEIEGSEVVAERGGQQIQPAPEEEIRVQEEAQPPSPVSPAAEASQDWGTMVQPQARAEAPPEPARAAHPDEDMKFAEDEGPSAPAEDMSPRAKADGETVAEVTWGEPAAAEAPQAEQPVIEMEMSEESSASASDGVEAEVSFEGVPDEGALYPEQAGAEAGSYDGGMEQPQGGELYQARAGAESASQAYEYGGGAEAQLAGGYEAQVEAEPYAASEPAPEPERAPLKPGALMQRALMLQPFPMPLSQPFTTVQDGVAVRVDGELLIRLSACTAVTGAITFLPEAKRYRGRPSDKPFGEGEQQFLRAHGRGAVLLSAGKRRFEVVELGDDAAYVRDQVLVAFEEPLMFENGRASSELGDELELVQLRGSGRALLLLDGPLRSLEVTADRPASVPLERLVGWVGNLSPTVRPLWHDPSGRRPPAVVELAGDGFALLAAPA